jgi:hypothetical protein
VQASSSTRCYDDPGSRAEWAGMSADPIISSDIAGQLLGSRLATANELWQIAAAWHE